MALAKVLLADRKTTTIWSHPIEDVFPVLLAVYMVFLRSAALWVGVTVYVCQTHAKCTGSHAASHGVTALRWTTAVASMTMLVLMVGTREPTLSWQQPLAQRSSRSII